MVIFHPYTEVEEPAEDATKRPITAAVVPTNKFVMI
jgi:hypothetical protein